MRGRKGKSGKLVVVCTEDKATGAKDNIEPIAACHGTLPFVHTRARVSLVSSGHIMFEGQTGKVFTSLKREFECKRKEVSVAKIRDLMEESWVKGA